MTKSDQYYFSDSIFQLELNLHNIRRELILMIEEFEKEDCFSCLQLKCRCAGKSPEKNGSSSGHNDSLNKSKEGLNESPPAVSLPKPRFEEVQCTTVFKEGNDVEAWIEASRTGRARSDRRLPTEVLLAFKKSWTESKSDITRNVLDDFKKEKILYDTRHAANAVEVFFNSFKMQPAVSAANLAYVNKVAAIYGGHKARSSEYTYF